MSTLLTNTPSFLYEKIVDDISTNISRGVLKPGEKLPSIRKLSNKLHVSMSTIIQAYIELEDLRLIEVKPQSGYYVRFSPNRTLPEIEIRNVESAIKNYGCDGLVTNLCELSSIPNIISLGAAAPSNENLPIKKLGNIIKSLCRSDNYGIEYEFSPGNPKLRREIAKKSFEWGYNSTIDDIVISSGGNDALNLSLRAVAKPGDNIAIECPTYYGLIQIIEELGMNAIRISTHPKHGMDVEALKKAVKNQKISACVLYPCISNPLGSVMPEDNKKEFYLFLSSKNIPIIEGDIYGELYFGKTRPTPIKAIDNKGIVLYHSSFSKTVAPGFRTGWVMPGRYFEKVKRLKYLSSIGSPVLPQLAIAEFLRSGGHERCLRKLRQIYSIRQKLLSSYISEYFPETTKISTPQGGLHLWVELPKEVDSIKLQRLALKENISIAPGPLFSTKDCFINCIRLSYATRWNGSIELAVKKVGEIAKSML